VADPSVKAMATAKPIAVGTDTVLVDDDTNAPVDSLPFYNDALSASGTPSTTWDLAKDPELPPNSMKAFKAIVWFTGNSYPGPAAGVRGAPAHHLGRDGDAERQAHPGGARGRWDAHRRRGRRADRPQRPPGGVRGPDHAERRSLMQRVMGYFGS
jgi:hypothetical protein